MLAQIMPVLPVLILAHGWMTLMLVRTLEDGDIVALPPEAFPI